MRGLGRVAVTLSVATLAAVLNIAPALAKPASVTPILECVYQRSDGSAVAVFGYRNDGSGPVPISVDDQNNFSPAPGDRGQPTLFEPGEHRSILVVDMTVEWSDKGLTWHLDGGKTTADANSARCISDPAVSEATVAVALPAAAAAAIGLFVRRTRRRQRDT